MRRYLLSILFLQFTLFTYSAELSVTDAGYGEFKLTSSPAELDSLLSIWYENNIYDSYGDFVDEFIDIEYDEIDQSQMLPDSVYAERLDMLATAIQLPYNPVVNKYIGVYTIKNKANLQRILGLAQYYMPMFEQELARNNLPLELKMLPVIESALNPRAISRAGAAGLWQFILPTGRACGLVTNTFVDERMSPLKSTQAACRFLKDMYGIYGDWTLVLAAYNCGAGNVNKALKRAGDKAKTYWDIYDYLPRETRGYVPAFIAATYAYTFHKTHNLEPIAPPHPIVTDTVMVKKMTHFMQISNTLNIPIEVIASLNPEYRMDIVPAKERECPLVLPMDDITKFIDNEQKIYSQDTIYLSKYINTKQCNIEATKAVKSVAQTSKKDITYKIKRGDTLGRIAIRYKVTTKQLMAWNNIKNASKLRIGQIIKIKR